MAHPSSYSNPNRLDFTNDLDDVGFSDADRERHLRQSLKQTLIAFGAVIVLFTLVIVLATAHNGM